MVHLWPHSFTIASSASQLFPFANYIVTLYVWCRGVLYADFAHSLLSIVSSHWELWRAVIRTSRVKLFFFCGADSAIGAQAHTRNSVAFIASSWRWQCARD
jgi:hypothetical protein